MKRHIISLTALVAALLLSSCFQHETSISLNKDGSGTLVEQSILGPHMLAMMTSLTQPGDPDPVAEMFGEEKAKERAAEMGEGVQYVKTEMINQDGKKGARVHYKFADINKLVVNPKKSVNDLGSGGGDGPGQEEASRAADNVSFKYAAGRLSIIMPPMDMAEAHGPGGEGNEAREQAMAGVMADMRVALKISFPGGIEKSNATHVDGNTVTIMDFMVGKLLTQKDALKKISETAKTDQAAAMAAFGKLEGVKIETRPDCSVSLK